MEEFYSPIIAKILSLVENRCLISYDTVLALSFSGMSVGTLIPRTKIKERSKNQILLLVAEFLSDPNTDSSGAWLFSKYLLNELSSQDLKNCKVILYFE